MIQIGHWKIFQYANKVGDLTCKYDDSQVVKVYDTVGSASEETEYRCHGCDTRTKKLCIILNVTSSVEEIGM